MNKITILGDIMCESRLLKSAKQRDGSYNFDFVFENIRPMLKEADYVIGNLETPLAGADAKYTNSMFSYNAPDSLADALIKAGISLVTTSNNHCLDRGIQGLYRTLDVLDEKNLAHFGTYRNEEERSEAAYFTVGNNKIALIAYTYGTNYAVHHMEISEDAEKCMNLLHSHRDPLYVKSKSNVRVGAVKMAVHKVFLLLPEENRIWIKRKLNREYNIPREDNYLDRETTAPFFSRLREDITEAKRHADIVLFYPHVGGQFNIRPGLFSEYTIHKALEYGCDCIVAAHPHIVQKAELINGVPCYYSIGNISLSPNSAYLLYEHLPDYGIAVHIYVDNRRIVKTSFSVLKIVESGKLPLTVYPADVYDRILKDAQEKERLYREVGQIYETVTGKPLQAETIQSEYDLLP